MSSPQEEGNSGITMDDFRASQPEQILHNLGVEASLAQLSSVLGDEVVDGDEASRNEWAKLIKHFSDALFDSLKSENNHKPDKVIELLKSTTYQLHVRPDLLPDDYKPEE